MDSITITDHLAWPQCDRVCLVLQGLGCAGRSERATPREHPEESTLFSEEKGSGGWEEDLCEGVLGGEGELILGC